MEGRLMMTTTPSSSYNTTNATNITDFSQLVLAEYISAYAITLFSLALLSLGLRKICCKSLESIFLALAHFEAWFALSVSFTMFNKFVFSYWGSGEFNLPFFMTSMHMTVKFICMIVFVKCFQKKNIQRPAFIDIFKLYIPIGIMTGLDIALVNLAVSYAAVSLVVVTKTTGIIFTLSLSVCMGLQKCTKTLSIIVLTTAVGSFLALWKEPNFVLKGVIMAALSSICGALRWTLTQYVSQKQKASVQTLIIFTAPAGVLVTFVCALLLESTTMSKLTDGTYGSGAFPLLLMIGLFGGIITLVLLVVEISLVSITSALATDVGAKVKDMCLIIISVAVYGDRITTLNIFGFLIVCFSVVWYGMYKNMSGKEEEIKYSAVVWEDDDVWEDSDVEFMGIGIGGNVKRSRSSTGSTSGQEVELTNI
jgi:hypothetical protein